MSSKSPVKKDTIKIGIKVKGTKYNKAGCAEFMTKRLTNVATIPKKKEMIGLILEPILAIFFALYLKFPASIKVYELVLYF